MTIPRNLSVLAQGAGSNQTLTLTNTSANALAVGRQGTTNPVLNVDASTASVVTGLNVKGAAAAGGVALSVTSSGTNEDVFIDPKGSGGIILCNNSTGYVQVQQTTNGSVASYVRNNSTGTAAYSTLSVVSSTGGSGELRQNGSSFTTSGIYQQNGTMLLGSAAGGLTVGTAANQPLYFAQNSAEAARIGTDKSFLVGGTTNAGAGAIAATSVSATALSIGRQGITNPVLNVDASTASVVTGLNLKGAAAAAGMAVSVTSSGTNENLTIDAKGSGTVTINGTATGGISIPRAVTLGVASTTQGSLVLANTSANSTTLKSSNSASAAYTITLPVSAGTSGQVLSTDGTGITSWITVSGAEYGTWTPGLSFGGGTTGIVITGQSGTYVKSGRSVIYGIYLATSSKGSSTGQARITNCPFTSESGATTKYSYGTPVNGGSGITVTSAYTLFLGTYYTGSATTLDFYEVSLGTPSSISNTSFSNSITFYGSVSVITTA